MSDEELYRAIKFYSERIRCADCKKYRSFGNGYGECGIFRHTMKDSDFCSYAEWREAGYDDHDHSGLIDE